MKIVVSNVCTAFNAGVVGTKVVKAIEFERLLLAKLEQFQFPANGQGTVPLPEALHTVVSGVARRQRVPMAGYNVRLWRGDVTLFADRQYAEPAEHLNIIVYTGDAYRTDPQVDHKERTNVGDATHVIVAVLASVGPFPPVGSWRFVRNLAGGNPAYAAEAGYTLQRAIEAAKEIIAYEAEWVTVSD